MIESIVLDWSGTMADDLGLTLVATNATLKHFDGEAVDLDTYRREFKIPVMEFYASRVRAGVTLEQVDDCFFGYYREGLSQVPLYDGLAELLAESSARGKKLFVLSTVPTDILEQGLLAHGLRGHFERIYGGATDKRPVLPRLLNDHGLEPSNTLYVGDTAHDIETGLAAKTRAGASLYGYGLEDALRSLEPPADYYFNDIAELRAMLDREHLFDSVPLVIPTVGGILRRSTGEILLVRTLKWSNTFGIPGGKIDYGETMEAAYVREIAEETGLRAINNRFVMIQDCIETEEFVKKRHFLLINYLSDVTNPEDLRINYEIEEARWCHFDAALLLKLNHPTRVVLDEARRLGLL
ncbi:MAG: NUDIX domain-containing protein [Planctomycetota bacterium]